jgi:hypothetical protein
VVIPDPKDVLKGAKAASKTAKQIAAVKGALRTDDGLQGDERALSAELDAETAAKSAKDVLLNESARILADEVALIKADTRLAAKVLPYALPTPRPRRWRRRRSKPAGEGRRGAQRALRRSALRHARDGRTIGSGPVFLARRPQLLVRVFLSFQQSIGMICRDAA